MSRSTNTTEQHYILSRNGETIAVDKIGRHSGFGAYARMMHRLAEAAGVAHLDCTDATGTVFQDGLTLEGPFEAAA